MIKHIIFDFGGVILNLSGKHSGIPDDLVAVFGISLEEAQSFWNENKTGLLTGEVSIENFIKDLAQHFSLTIDINQVFAAWTQQNTITEKQIDWELISCIQDLKARYKVHMLTDQIALDNGSAAWRHKIDDHFHTFFRSYEQGFRKPDPESFLNVLKQLGAQPEECVFIDDTLKNIEAAQQLGIHSILYTFGSSSTLRSELRQLGITNF